MALLNAYGLLKGSLGMNRPLSGIKEPILAHFLPQPLAG